MFSKVKMGSHFIGRVLYVCDPQKNEEYLLWNVTTLPACVLKIGFLAEKKRNKESGVGFSTPNHPTPPYRADRFAICFFKWLYPCTRALCILYYFRVACVDAVMGSGLVTLTVVKDADYLPPSMLGKVQILSFLMERSLQLYCV